MGGPSFKVAREDTPYFTPLSLGRKGPGQRVTIADVAQISRIVRGAPEVMVKVTGGGSGPAGVMASLRYVGREGQLPIETDTGDPVLSRAQQRELVKSWNLDLVRGRYRDRENVRLGTDRKPRTTRVAYNIVLGMPAPTPPKAVQAAARQFAREQFGATHRYAMVLHTDQAHPHVHLIVKAEDERGQRLRIDKAKLRAWRERFAEALRDRGIEANASSRFERGHHGRRLNTKTLRATQHRRSDKWVAKVRSVRAELTEHGDVLDPGRPVLEASRDALHAQWLKTAATLEARGKKALAQAVKTFVRSRPEPLTGREQLAERMTVADEAFLARAQEQQQREIREREIERERVFERERERERVRERERRRTRDRNQELTR